MVALPAYSMGNSLNFQPVQNALTQVAQTNALNRQFGLQQEQLGLQKQQVASQLKGAALDQEAKYAQLTGGIAQSALDSKDPTKIQAAWGQLKNSHPEFVSNLVAHGIDPNDATGGLTFITNEARGYMNPLDVEAKKAQIADLTSQAQYRQGQLGLMKRQIDMGQRLFNGADAAQPSATGPKPGDVDSGYRFKGGNPGDPNAWEPVQ